MPDVYILGAGFSKAVSHEMPVLAELPTKLARLNGSPEIREYLDQFDNNVEHALTYLSQAQPFLRESENLRHRADFLDLVRNIGVAVAFCQQAAIGGGECPVWFSDLVEIWDESGCIVMSFNWDTLVEKMYCALPGEERFVSQIYGMPITTVGARPGFAVIAPGDARTFSLLKLHGSINWYYSGAQAFFGESIYYAPVAPGWNLDNIQTEYESTPDKVPLIVPPTVEKSSFFANESVQYQWQQARFELDSNSDVYILGYSLPETDMLVRFLLSRLDKNTRVYLVNKLSPERTRSDDDVRDEFIERHRSILPIDENWLNSDWVSVGEDVLPGFVEAYKKGEV